MDKKIWNEPDVEMVDIEETAGTYLEGEKPDGGTYTYDCEPAGPLYS